MINQSYAWSRLEDPVPGFEIPDHWSEEDGMRRYGKLNLTYNSSKLGAKSIWRERAKLKELTVCGRGFIKPP